MNVPFCPWLYKSLRRGLRGTFRKKVPVFAPESYGEFGSVLSENLNMHSLVWVMVFTMSSRCWAVSHDRNLAVLRFPSHVDCSTFILQSRIWNVSVLGCSEVSFFEASKHHQEFCYQNNYDEKYKEFQIIWTIASIDLEYWCCSNVI